ncbi:MAG: hypothetical protein KBE38_15210 [Ignavibacterium sp.]|nr:hypothetical protein [Ignavibacterium sp.]
MDNFYVFKTKRKRSNYVIQSEVIYKGKTFQFRADYELRENIENLAKGLDQSDAKVIKDILDNFFLDQKLKRQQFELEGIENE